MIGGYKIIDMRGFDLTNANGTIDGIWDRIESSVGKKPLLVTNFKRDGVEQVPVLATTFMAPGGVNNIQVAILQISNTTYTFTVSSDDHVQIRSFS